MPAAVPNNGKWNEKGLQMSCSATNLPGITFATFDSRLGSPNISKMPYDVVFEQVRLTFQITNSMEEHNAIEAWMRYIYNKETEDFAYPATYKTDILIHQLDNTLGILKTVKLKTAYPTAMGEVALSYDENNTISTFVVTLAYRDWETL